MRIEEFSELRKELIKKCVNLVDTKGKDYTKGDPDVLKAFKEGGSYFDVEAEKYLGFALKKHMDAIYSYIKTNGESESEPIDLRITDAINYLIFLHALIVEKKAEVSE